MRVVIPVNRPVQLAQLTFDDLSERFARAPFFLVIENGKQHIVRNVERALGEKGVGKEVVEQLKPEAVIARAVGEGIKKKLEELGTKIYIVGSEKELEHVLKELGLKSS
ncbi:MAG: hypothetical protein GXO42_03195 [bacterium]|nr:hypothetical protein [bacterium]